jgi:hypothetical protein
MAAGTRHTARLYALIVSALVFFLVWAVVAAHPWQRAAADPRLAALTRREQRLRADAIRVQKLVTRRFSDYRIQLARRKAQIAAAKRRQAQLNAAARRRQAELAAAAQLAARQQAFAAQAQVVPAAVSSSPAPAVATPTAPAPAATPPPAPAAAAPPVRVVTLPPLVVTRTS